MSGTSGSDSVCWIARSSVEPHVDVDNNLFHVPRWNVPRLSFCFTLVLVSVNCVCLSYQLVMRRWNQAWTRVYIVLSRANMQHFWSRASSVLSEQAALAHAGIPLSSAVPTHTLDRDKAARQAADLELLEWQQQRAARCRVGHAILGPGSIPKNLLIPMHGCCCGMYAQRTAHGKR